MTCLYDCDIEKSSGFELRLVEIRVHSSLIQQEFVTALLYYSTIIDYQNQIGI